MATESEMSHADLIPEHPIPGPDEALLEEGEIPPEDTPLSWADNMEQPWADNVAQPMEPEPEPEPSADAVTMTEPEPAAAGSKEPEACPTDPRCLELMRMQSARLSQLEDVMTRFQLIMDQTMARLDCDVQRLSSSNNQVQKNINELRTARDVIYTELGMDKLHGHARAPPPESSFGRQPGSFNRQPFPGGQYQQEYDGGGGGGGSWQQQRRSRGGGGRR
jgi:uncharacterized coiled-coil protein SlyX